MTRSFKYLIIVLTILMSSANVSSLYAATDSVGSETQASVTIGEETAAKMVAEADSAYSKGEFERAANIYGQVLESVGPSASLLYNLGNACYRMGNEGEARLYLERAKRLDPSDEYINQNIAYLSTRITDVNKAELKGKKGDVAPDAEGFFGKVDRNISIDTSSDSWARLAVMAFILLVLTLAAYLFSRNVYVRKFGFFSALAFLFFAVIFVVFSEMAASHFESKDEAVLIQFKTTLSAEPTAESTAVGFPLHRGTKFRILDTELNADGEAAWYKVELNHNNIGWVAADAVEVI